MQHVLTCAHLFEIHIMLTHVRARVWLACLCRMHMQVLLAVLQALEEQSSKVMLGDLHPLGPVPIYPDDAPVGPAAAAAGSAAGSTSTASNQHGQVPARASSSASGPGRPKVVGSSRGTASLQDDCCAVLAQPGTLKAVAWAVVRGLTVTELAYQEFGRRALPSASRTAAVMHIRLSELVFEGPQV
jgi:hypothetical protein